MKVERRIEIEAPPEEVYDLVMDPHRLGDWVTIHEELKEAPDGSLREGSELIQRLKLAHRKFNVHWQVVEADRPRRVIWEGKGPVRSRARVAYGIEPNSEGTSFSYENEYNLPFGPLGEVAGRAVKRASVRETEKTLDRLKSVLET